MLVWYSALRKVTANHCLSSPSISFNLSHTPEYWVPPLSNNCFSQSSHTPERTGPSGQVRVPRTSTALAHRWSHLRWDEASHLCRLVFVKSENCRASGEDERLSLSWPADEAPDQTQPQGLDMVLEVCLGLRSAGYHLIDLGRPRLNLAFKTRRASRLWS